VRFWDTSAIIPLWINEQGSARAKAWHRNDPDVVVWTLSRVEVLSALARRRRDQPGTTARLLVVRREFIRAWDEWSEVTAVEIVRRHAERIVESYPLRAADAMQIGAAIVAAEDDPTGFEFVSFDENLARAAEHEGFRVLGSL
jgi:Predicted nucleic acid-binding protein, contains PIN domain